MIAETMETEQKKKYSNKVNKDDVKPRRMPRNKEKRSHFL